MPGARPAVRRRYDPREVRAESDMDLPKGNNRRARVPHLRDELSMRASPDDELLLAFRQGKLLGLRLRRDGAGDSVRILVPYRQEAVASAFENGVEVGFCKEAPKSTGIVFLRRGGGARAADDTAQARNDPCPGRRRIGSDAE